MITERALINTVANTNKNTQGNIDQFSLLNQRQSHPHKAIIRIQILSINYSKKHLHTAATPRSITKKANQQVLFIFHESYGATKTPLPTYILSK